MVWLNILCKSVMAGLAVTKLSNLKKQSDFFGPPYIYMYIASKSKIKSRAHYAAWGLQMRVKRPTHTWMSLASLLAALSSSFNTATSTTSATSSLTLQPQATRRQHSLRPWCCIPRPRVTLAVAPGGLSN